MNKFILGIESSCDDTSVAIVSSEKKIVAHKTYTQIQEHQLYKGIVPEIAARAHIEHISPLIQTVLKSSNLEIKDLHAIASTSGPGLIGGIMVGTMVAKAIAASANKPFIAINHLEGHALTVRLTENIEYPYLGLLISGGHCQFIIIEKLSQYKILGSTLDDSCGECFDKIASLMNLGFPGGPIIETNAKHGKKLYNLPMPMIQNVESCDMSFSGLKTATKILINQLSPLNQEKIYDICYSLQYAICQTLKHKILVAIKKYEDMGYNKKNFVLSGGVAANLYIRNSIIEAISPLGYRFYAPPTNLCTDNAAMIAWVAQEYAAIQNYTDIRFEPKATWPINSI